MYSDDTFTWVQNAGGHPYIGTKLGVTDPATAYASTVKTTQARDQYGSTTQFVTYPFNNTTTPLKTFNSAYLTTKYPMGAKCWLRFRRAPDGYAPKDRAQI